MCVFSLLIAVARLLDKGVILVTSPHPCQVSVPSTLRQHPGKEIFVSTSKFHGGKVGALPGTRTAKASPLRKAFFPTLVSFLKPWDRFSRLWYLGPLSNICSL